jgi:hypothetical protein
VKKEKFAPATIGDTIHWLRTTGYVPNGRGKHTETTSTRGDGKE